MNYIQPNKELYKQRLQEWKDELQTNKFGMQHLAQRAIAVIEGEMKEIWPDDSDKK